LRKGEKAWNWRERIRMGLDYRLWRESVFKRDNYTCVWCGTRSGNGKAIYLEAHHFIPREFRNDFSYSIEVLANYITLCPRCHRQIHLAVDRERKHLINALYEDRKNRLEC